MVLRHDNTTCIDAAWYPHLIEKILTSASLRALISYRCTSRENESEVYRILKKQGCHMVLAKKRFNTYELGFRDGSTVLYPQTPSLVEDLVATTRLLDLDGDAIQTNLGSLASTLTDLKVVRVVDYQHPPMGGPQLLPFHTPTYIVSLNTYGNELHFSERRKTPFRNGLTKLVVVIHTGGSYSDVRLSNNQSSVFYAPPNSSLEHFVFIFTEIPGASPKEEVDSHFLGRMQLFALLVTAARHYCQRPSLKKFILVGLPCLVDCLVNQSLIQSDDHTLDTRVTAFVEDLASLCKEHPDVVQVLTPEEYRAEVGEGQYALETMA